MILNQDVSKKSSPNYTIFNEIDSNHSTFGFSLGGIHDILLSSASPAMTSPIKLEHQQNRQHYAQQQYHNHHMYGSLSKNLHLSEVITTGPRMNIPHSNGVTHHRHNGPVDVVDMNKLLNNITTPRTHLPSKPCLTTSNMDYSSRLHHFSWEEIEGRHLPVIFRNENGCLQRYTSKMFVENTLFQSESWQRHALLARSLPPLISFPYTENELKLFRLIVEWHLASFHFKTILPTDCLIRYEDLLEFYGALRKLRDSMTANGFHRQLMPPLLPPPPPIPPPPLPPLPIPTQLPLTTPKPRLPSNMSNLTPSFELPTMIGHNPIKPNSHPNRSQSAAKPYGALSHTIPSVTSTSVPTVSTYMLQTDIGQRASFSTTPSSVQWKDTTSKPKPMIPMNNSNHRDSDARDKMLALVRAPRTLNEEIPMSRETKECGWVQINNVFVPYVIKMKQRENESEKSSARQIIPSLQRELFVPYEILIKCNIFLDQDFAFKKFLIKATQQDFDIFNSLITNINIFDEKTPEKTPLVNLYHVMVGLPKLIYVKLLTTKHPRAQVNKYHADVISHKGGTLLMMPGNKLVPYILQNSRFYVPLMFTYQTMSHVFSQAKRGARAPRQHEIDYLNLLLIYFNIDSAPFTSDTLLVDAYSVKCPNYQPPVHFRTLTEHQQFEKTRLSGTIVRMSSKTQASVTKSTVNITPTNNKTNKCPPTNVVVNPMIHHPSFYGLSQTTTTTRVASSANSSVIVNPLLLPTNSDHPSDNQDSTTFVKYPLIKSIQYDQHNLNFVVKSAETNPNDWKIPIRHIFEEFGFQIDYQTFIEWCQTNELLPLTKIESDEKQISRFDSNDDFFVLQRHLDRCIALLNDLKRGTISMTLLPSSSLVKLSVTGSKKRKTTHPTTRHATSTAINNVDETNPNAIDSEQESETSISTVTKENSNEQQDQEVDSSFLIIDTHEGDDTKIQLDDTLPSCSSGYESALALNPIDTNEDDETKSMTRSREYSSSCQSEQSFIPIPSNVSSNIEQAISDDENNDDHRTNSNNKESKQHVRSRSPTPRFNKKKRSSDDSIVSANTITSDQIEQHLRTLAMPGNDQRRVRKRSIKAPTRLVEEISVQYSMKMIESETNVFDSISSTSTSNNDSTTNSHQSCTYNVTISNKPNKLGLTIKKVLPR